MNSLYGQIISLVLVMRFLCVVLLVDAARIQAGAGSLIFMSNTGVIPFADKLNMVCETCKYLREYFTSYIWYLSCNDGFSSGSVNFSSINFNFNYLLVLVKAKRFLNSESFINVVPCHFVLYSARKSLIMLMIAKVSKLK